MVYSDDDEGTTFVKYVSEYALLDEHNHGVPLSDLPIYWSEGKPQGFIREKVFVKGKTDGGLLVYKEVIGWKMDLSFKEPDISVLTTETNWIKLVKPKASFVGTMRSILITVQFLHCLKKNPTRPEISVWDYIHRSLSFDVRPSEKDLLAHLTIISEAANIDDTISSSEYLHEFLQNPKKRKAVLEDKEAVIDVKKSKFIVDDDEECGQDVRDADGDDSEDEEDLFDSVCAICDDGGEIIGCEGRCMRSFHALIGTGTESSCRTLGYTRSQLEAIPHFLCLNCEHNIHCCYVCKELGPSDRSAEDAVFPCVSATCGYFYHPGCVAGLLYKDPTEAEVFGKKFAEGEPFTCPVHKCCRCNEHEDLEKPDCVFALCRRCPRAYHRKCLPRKIAFEDNEDDDDITTRAWEGLLTHKRILIYCLKHRIDEDLGTPVRTHVRFPGEKRRQSFDSHPKKLKNSAVTERLVSGGPSSINREKHHLEHRVGSLQKSKTFDASRKPIKESAKLVPVMERKSLVQDDTKAPLQEQKLGVKTVPSLPKKSVQECKVPSSSAPSLDAETQKRLMALMDNAASSVTLKDIAKNHVVPSTHKYSLKQLVEKEITMGKVQGFVEALRNASRKLDEGCGINDAKAICPVDVVRQIDKWKNKLSIYLAPFLHGVRYTSFGRHFTKPGKLVEIVDMLHWYVQNGDTIVDFCCGSNDFSALMKTKLNETGKRCKFRNFDIIRPRNDFDFKQTDWMDVSESDFPKGSDLIIGLNPPFGYKASLANKFINKALEFKPKLVILIVPPETEGLDKKRHPYDLVWEDTQKLSGMSFYLPGSVDVHNNPMDQWNATAPVLYLWSRKDLTSKHKDIALKHGHPGNEGEQLHREAMELDNEGEQLHREAMKLDNAQIEIPMGVSPDHGLSALLTGHDDISNQNTLSNEHNKKESEAIVPKTDDGSSPKTIYVDESRHKDPVSKTLNSLRLKKIKVQKKIKDSKMQKKIKDSNGKENISRRSTESQPIARNQNPDISDYNCINSSHWSGDYENFLAKPEIVENITGHNPNSSEFRQTAYEHRPGAYDNTSIRAEMMENIKNPNPGNFEFGRTDFSRQSGPYENFSIREERLEDIKNFRTSQTNTAYENLSIMEERLEDSKNFRLSQTNMFENLGDIGRRYSHESFQGYEHNLGYNFSSEDKYGRGDVGQPHRYARFSRDHFSECNFPPPDPRYRTQYGLSSLVPDTSFNPANTSAMNCYAPRLDDTNFGRTSNYGMDLPSVVSSRYSSPGHLIPPPGVGAGYPRNDGFSHGPSRLYPYLNSNGWLPE